MGFTDENGSIPIKKLEKILNIIDGKLKLTFHKAFDLLKSPFQDLKTLTDFGFDTILTSGREKTAFEGINFINTLRNISNGDISIMPGGSINSENFKFFKIHEFEWIHLSAKKQLNSDNQRQIKIRFTEQPIYNIDVNILKKINHQNKP